MHHSDIKKEMWQSQYKAVNHALGLSTWPVRKQTWLSIDFACCCTDGTYNRFKGTAFTHSKRIDLQVVAKYHFPLLIILSRFSAIVAFSKRPQHKLFLLLTDVAPVLQLLQDGQLSIGYLHPPAVSAVWRRYLQIDIRTGGAHKRSATQKQECPLQLCARRNTKSAARNIQNGLQQATHGSFSQNLQKLTLPKVQVSWPLLHNTRTNRFSTAPFLSSQICAGHTWDRYESVQWHCREHYAAFTIIL